MSDDPRSPWADDSGLDGEPTGETPADLPSTPYDRPYEDAVEPEGFAEPQSPPPPPPPAGNEPTTTFGGSEPPSGPVPTMMPMPPPDRRRWYNDKPAAAAAAGVGVALLFLMIAGLIWYFSRDDGSDSITTATDSSTTTVVETTTTVADTLVAAIPSTSSSTTSTSSSTTSTTTTTTTTTTTVAPTTTEAPTTTQAPTTTAAPTTTTTSTPVVTVPQSPGSTTWDIIQVSPQLSTLRELVVLAALENELDSATAQRTIFAPSNQAFEEIEQLVDLTDPVIVRDLLQRHIVTGSYSTQSIFGDDTLVCLRMQNTELIAINDDETFGETSVPLAVRDVESANGYLHAINRILARPEGPCPAP